MRLGNLHILQYDIVIYSVSGVGKTNTQLRQPCILVHVAVKNIYCYTLSVLTGNAS